ncbi:MAG: hypothetical protein ACTSX6_02375 [Candidatus Heimdallarchaeaceae archaeon]
MKKFELLALKDYEFIDMVAAIAKERQTLRVKKRDEHSITVSCYFGIRVSLINYKTEKKNDNLLIYRKINWFPLFYSTIPFFLFLEAILMIINYFVYNDFLAKGLYVYFLIALAWLLAIVFFVYQTFTEIDEIHKKLYRIEV